jgi:hypothetical protein|tara:strand:+ start:8510 stop:9871 length:1362 start_codon:yes stop_codon:yes gene_type:complete
MLNQKQIVEKWAPMLDAEGVEPIVNAQKRAVTAVALENTERALTEERGQSSFLSEAPTNSMGASSSTAGAGAIDTWDPILISLVRRSMPNLIAYDMAGVQPMTGPTGLIFAMKSTYVDQSGAEALFNEANAGFSGNNAAANATAVAGSSEAMGADSSSLGGTDTTPADTVNDAFGIGTGMTRAAAEALGTDGGEFAEMSFTIDKTTVTARSRALKAEYTMELAQDLKAVHGLDAESELANILSGEILAEVNREVLRTVNSRARLGAQQTGLTTAGTFDLSTDADGRWAVEKIKMLLLHIQREANQIAVLTRRGKGNFVVVSSDIAASLNAAGVLDYTAPLNGLSVDSDPVGPTVVGTIGGNMKVILDPYATVDYCTVGYKGSNAYDAGMFYCPYVPLTMVRAVGENSFQPKIGFKTRYGMVANPFVDNTNEVGAVRTNDYYRIFAVANVINSA